jgi:hypothetical protein
MLVFCNFLFHPGVPPFAAKSNIFWDVATSAHTLLGLGVPHPKIEK